MMNIGQGVMGTRSLRGKVLGVVMATVIVSGCTGKSDAVKPRIDDNALYEGRATVTFANLPVAKTAEAAITEGDKQLRVAEYDKALYMYIHALELDSKNTEALYKIGNIHLQRGGMYKAIMAFNDVLTIDPSHVGASESRGVLYLKDNAYAEAQKLFMQAVEEDEKRLATLEGAPQVDAQSPAMAYDGLGIIADLRGDHVLAQHYYNAALKIKPNSAITYNNLGYSYYLTKNWKSAEKSYKRALKLQNEYAQAWRNLGLLYARQGNYMSAVTAFERVMDTAQAYNDVGYICLLEGSYNKAEQFFEQAMTMSPTYYEKANDNLKLARRLREGILSMR